MAITPWAMLKRQLHQVMEQLCCEDTSEFPNHLIEEGFVRLNDRLEKFNDKPAGGDRFWRDETRSPAGLSLNYFYLTAIFL